MFWYSHSHFIAGFITIFTSWFHNYIYNMYYKYDLILVFQALRKAVGTTELSTADMELDLSW